MDNSPLHRLPPAIRTSIWTHVLTSPPQPKPKVKKRKPQIYERRHLTSRNMYLTDLPLRIPLMETCRAIRAETRLLFYASNDFYFKLCKSEKAQKLLAFFHRIGKEAVSHLGPLYIKCIAGKDLCIVSVNAEDLVDQDGRKQGWNVKLEGYHRMVQNVYGKMGLKLYSDWADDYPKELWVVKWSKKKRSWAERSYRERFLGLKSRP